MKSFRIILGTLLAALAPGVVFADLVGPYTPDANTLFLLHFDEAIGGSVTTNVGTKGGNFYTVANSTSGNGLATPPTVTTMLGAPGYVNGATNFNNCLTNPAAGDFAGFDFNNSGAYQGDVSSGTQSPDRLAMTNLNMGNGGQTPFTLEALIRPAGTATPNQEIICTDNSQGNTLRGFQFRITGGQLQLQFVGGTTPSAVSGTIPTSGNDAFVAGNWYHVAAVYNGTNLTLYWTLLNPTNGAAHVLNSGAMTIDATRGAIQSPLVIGNENRNSSQEQFQGCIDEVRISSVARAANQMQFFSPVVTITQNPISQNVDYNQNVTFNVGASSLTTLGYQWRFNSSPVSSATNSSYVITNVAAGNAGNYDVIVTNTAGYSATSSPAILVVGAAHFLNHRYSFTTDTSDSIGTANGTNFGTATVSGGSLVLDGSVGCYMQLPGGLFNISNATALTFEFWGTFGVNSNFARVFDCGYTNVVLGNVVGVNYVGFSPHNGSGGHQIHISSGDNTFQQQVTATGTLDGLTRHIACVIDPPNQTMSIYTNGTLEASITNMTVGIGSLNDTFTYIGRSLFAADPYLNASIDELRIYNGALAGLSIKQSDDQGPGTVLADGPAKFVTQPQSTSVPVGQTASFSVSTVGYLPITYQWVKNGTPVPGATTASYSFTTVIGDNNSSIFCYATNSIGVTTYITNSTTATLSVFVPPTLAWLDLTDGAADSSWNTNSLDWTNTAGGGAVIAFSQTNAVLFDSRGANSPTVDLGTNVIIPYSITVNAATDFTLTSSTGGSLSGPGFISKQNTDTLIIDVTNRLSGPVTVSGGILQVGNSDSLGSLGSGAVTNNATLSLKRSDTALSLANPIHGTGTVSMDGFGSVGLGGASDYTGNTLLNSGIVFLQSATGLGAATGTTTVAGGAQLYVTANVNVAQAGLTLNGVGDGNGALRKGGMGFSGWTGAVTMASDSTIGVDSGATLSLSNGITGSAALTLAGAGTLTLNAAGSYANGTTLNGPVVNLNVNGALGPGLVSVSGNGRFVLADGLNFTNSVSASSVNPGVATGLLMVNDNTNGTVTTVSGPLAFNAPAASGGHFVGPTTSGYLNVSGVITMPAATALGVRFGNVRFSGAGSTYSEIQVRANTTSLGANNGIATNAVVDLAGNGSTTAPTFLDLNGFNQSLAGLKNTVASTNVGWVTNSGGTGAMLTLDLGSLNTYVFDGSIVGNVGLTFLSGQQTLENGGAALDGIYNYTGSTIINGGTLLLNTGINLTGTTNINIASGATLDVSATTLSLGAAQKIMGNGLVNGNLTTTGTVAPGAPIGVLAVNGNATLGGLTSIEVSKTLLTNSQLAVAGAVNYGGTLFATNVAGTLNIGDSFTIVTQGSFTGNFSSVTGSPGSGKAWSFNPTNGVLSVIAGAATNRTNITMTINGNALTLTWPGDHLGWILQAQTNRLNKGISTNWADVAGSGSSTQAVFNVNYTNGTVFYRLRSP